MLAEPELDVPVEVVLEPFPPPLPFPDEAVGLAMAAMLVNEALWVLTAAVLVEVPLVLLPRPPLPRLLFVLEPVQIISIGMSPQAPLFVPRLPENDSDALLATLTVRLLAPSS